MLHFCSVINNSHSITQELEIEGRTVHVRRLDLIDEHVNGNKFYKLKYNLLAAQENGCQPILSFGGPYSNHLYSLAAAGKKYGIPTIGIVRGEWSGREGELHTPTLRFAQSCGMRLEFVTNLAYAEKETDDFKAWLRDQYGDFHLVPEGGSNFLGVNGCMEILNSKDKEEYDHIFLACGTGATTAGITLSKSPNQKVYAVSALKGGDFLRDEIRKHLYYFFMDGDAADEMMTDVAVLVDYHFGGYGKWTPDLEQFIAEQKASNNLPLDPVYTAKAFFALKDQLAKGMIAKHEKVLFIHTGGLQKTEEPISF